ncbi:hypothetical protein CSOJ01_13526 [Colletotrichum sojae]|uniref:Uncharacterized protein n=1 Tax=Colletotrichum sojae TaxID=2175907 RepID=A0A8H6ISQ6_9PEZI|nr:hypothetical protein CSOJ01_13526 [Colletotrichum sojae]
MVLDWESRHATWHATPVALLLPAGRAAKYRRLSADALQPVEDGPPEHKHVQGSHQGGAEAAGHGGMSAPAIVPVIKFVDGYRIAHACIVSVPLNQYQDLGCSFAKYVIAAQRRKFLHDLPDLASALEAGNEEQKQSDQTAEIRFSLSGLLRTSQRTKLNQ